jgi:hypothetical protein
MGRKKEKKGEEHFPVMLEEPALTYINFEQGVDLYALRNNIWIKI